MNYFTGESVQHDHIEKGIHPNKMIEIQIQR